MGAFYQPSLVVADPDTLKSRPERHFINGLAEAVKAGLIAESDQFSASLEGLKRALGENDETELKRLFVQSTARRRL